MKKTYIEPSVWMEGTETETIICTSQTITSSGIDTSITYGGVDEDGTKDPSSRRYNNVWDEE